MMTAVVVVATIAFLLFDFLTVEVGHHQLRAHSL
jgi:hypothetical protein